ncbi:hypothetical protein GW17_00036902 [Ensete ventricosum]|nr:hypothetical protein GW17_00036902 [Ensete ventricosum]
MERPPCSASPTSPSFTRALLPAGKTTSTHYGLGFGLLAMQGRPINSALSSLVLQPWLVEQLVLSSRLLLSLPSSASSSPSLLDRWLELAPEVAEEVEVARDMAPATALDMARVPMGVLEMRNESSVLCSASLGDTSDGRGRWTSVRDRSMKEKQQIWFGIARLDAQAVAEAGLSWPQLPLGRIRCCGCRRGELGIAVVDLK